MQKSLPICGLLSSSGCGAALRVYFNSCHSGERNHSQAEKPSLGSELGSGLGLAFAISAVAGGPEGWGLVGTC